MRMLIRILDELLETDDPRWATFGLNRPDADTTPAAPKNLTVNIAEGQVLMAACEAVPLAARYRWRIKVVGLEEDFRLAASTKSPLAQLDKVRPGQTVEVMVQAGDRAPRAFGGGRATFARKAHEALAFPVCADILAGKKWTPDVEACFRKIPRPLNRG